MASLSFFDLLLLLPESTREVPLFFPLLSFCAMEKSKSFPDQYSSYVKTRYDVEDHPRAYSFNGPSSKGDGFGSSGNPELKRKKRVAAYNMYAMEGKLKSSLRSGIKWIKSKFSDDYFDV